MEAEIKGRGLPPLDQRMPDAAKPHYFRYRQISNRTHPTVMVVAMSHLPDEQRWFEMGYVAYSALLTGYLALVVHDRPKSPAVHALWPICQNLATICDTPPPQAGD